MLQPLKILISSSTGNFSTNIYLDCGFTSKQLHVDSSQLFNSSRGLKNDIVYVSVIILTILSQNCFISLYVIEYGMNMFV